jgi:hypothetical protein
MSPLLYSTSTRETLSPCQCGKETYDDCTGSGWVIFGVAAMALVLFGPSCDGGFER